MIRSFSDATRARRRLLSPAVVGAVLAAVAAGTGAGCGRDEGAAAAAAEMPARPPSAVAAVAAVAQDVPLYLEEIGRCAPRELVTIRPQVDGRVTEIHVGDGAEVKKGDKLFTIDPRPYEALLAAAKATLAQRAAELELAKVEFERISGLIKNNSVSQQEYDDRRLGAAVSAAQVAAAQAAVETAQLDLEYCFVTAPIDGRAGQRLVDVGNVVRENEGSLLVIQRVDPIYADFTVVEQDLPAVRKHMADGTLRVEVRTPGAAEPRTGDLTFLDTAVQAGAGTVKLRATLANADRHFWAGQFVEVRLVLKVQKDAVLVPAQAVQVGQTGPYVYVVTKESTAELRPITPSQRQGDRVVVEKGLKAGEQVVTVGHMMVAPGGPVAVQPPAGARPAAPGEKAAPVAGEQAAATQDDKVKG